MDALIAQASDQQPMVEPGKPAYGSMGLSGMWGLIGNSTSMLVVAVVLFVSIYQIHGMHREGMAMMERLHNQEREFNRETQRSQRDVIQKNTDAMGLLAKEIRELRERRGP